MTQQKPHDLLVDQPLRLIHLHLQRTEIMQQRPPPRLLNDPIGIRPVLDQQLTHQETNLLVLKTISLLNQTVQSSSQRVHVHRVGFVDLGVGEDQVSHDLVVAAVAGDDQGGLLVGLGLLVDVDVPVPQQVTADLFQALEL